jgi:hypothetical protein
MTITIEQGVTVGQGIYIGDIPGNRVPHVVTAVSNGKVSTAQVKFGTGSYSSGIAGATGGLLVTPVTDFAFGLNDFTIEFWFNPTGYADCIAVDMRPLTVASGSYPTISPRATGAMAYVSNGLFRISSSTTATPLNTWVSVAVVRYQSNTRMYINGVQEGVTFADTTNYLQGSCTIACRGTEQSGAFPIRGYLDEIRISNIARYTGPYTPATQPFVNDPYTLLLLHCDGANGSTVFQDSTQPG